uniref:Uncharacterized protein n=1 Tax=Arion vulgaris TaxID=1028688 RepID=A0A0B7B4N3_9EUPU
MCKKFKIGKTGSSLCLSSTRHCTYIAAMPLLIQLQGTKCDQYTHQKKPNCMVRQRTYTSQHPS